MSEPFLELKVPAGSGGGKAVANESRWQMEVTTKQEGAVALCATAPCRLPSAV